MIALMVGWLLQESPLQEQEAMGRRPAERAAAGSHRFWPEEEGSWQRALQRGAHGGPTQVGWVRATRQRAQKKRAGVKQGIAWAQVRHRRRCRNKPWQGLQMPGGGWAAAGLVAALTPC